MSRPFDFVLTTRHSQSHCAIGLNIGASPNQPLTSLYLSFSCLLYYLVLSLLLLLLLLYLLLCFILLLLFMPCLICVVSLLLSFFVICVFCQCNCNCNMQPATCNCICIRISLCARGRARSSSLPRNFAQRCQCCIVMIAPGIGTISNKRCRCRR